MKDECLFCDGPMDEPCKAPGRTLHYVEVEPYELRERFRP